MTAITVALAISVGRGSSTVWVGLAALAGQLSVGWSNDYLDRHRDAFTARLDKPIVAGRIASRTVGIAALAAAAACVPFSLLAGRVAGFVHIAAVGVAWAYNGWLKRTVASPLPYAVAFGSLPAFVTLGLPGAPVPEWWALLSAALLGTGAHFINTLPDLDDDIRVGVRGLPHRIGARPSVVAAGALLGAAVIVAAMAPDRSHGAATALILTGTLATDISIVVLAWRQRTRAAWTLTMCLALLAVVLLIVSGGSLTT